MNPDWFLMYFLVLVFHRPLHLAIIHQQPAVATKLIQTIINTPQSKFINKYNHLSQVISTVFSALDDISHALHLHHGT